MSVTFGFGEGPSTTEREPEVETLERALCGLKGELARGAGVAGALVLTPMALEGLRTLAPLLIFALGRTMGSGERAERTGVGDLNGEVGRETGRWTTTLAKSTLAMTWLSGESLDRAVGNTV